MRSTSAPHRLGRRQLDVLRAAAADNCVLKHGSQGRSFVNGVTEHGYPDTVADTLLDYEMIELVEDDKIVNGYRVRITDAGTEWLAARSREETS